MAILNYSQTQADPWGKHGSAGSKKNAGRVHTEYTTKTPASVPLNIAQPVHIDLCICCGETATVTAFLADQGRVKLCTPCAMILGVDDKRGQNEQELPY